MRIQNKYTAIFCCIFCSPLIHSQSPPNNLQELKSYRLKLDSLRHYLDQGKVSIFSQHCRLSSHFEYYFTSPDQLLPASSLGLSSNQKDAYARMYADYFEANRFYEKKNYLQADVLWQKALESAVKEDFNYEELHILRPALNNICFLTGNYSRAMRVSTEGLLKAGRINDEMQAAHFNNVIGHIHMKQGNDREALNYFSKFLKEAVSLNDTLLYGQALCNLGELYFNRSLFDSSIMVFQRALDLYASAEPHGNQNFSPQERKAFVLSKISATWRMSGDYPRALAYASEALQIAMNNPGINEYDKSGYLINTGMIFSHLRIQDSATRYLQAGIDVARKIQHREYLRDGFRELASVFSSMQVFDSAFFYQQAYLDQRDSIEMESGQLEIFQQEISLREEQQHEAQAVLVEKQRNLRNIIAGIAIALIVIMYLLYNRRRLKQKEKYQQELNKQQIDLFNAVASAQDQERKRIAQDIHDSLGAILSATKLKLSGIQQISLEGQDTPSNQFREILSLLDEASSELRSISHNIMPASLSKLGLVSALINLTETISANAGFNISFSAYDLRERLPEEMEMSIYRIILELVNNIVRHSQASEATIQLIGFPDYINISIEDNGIGFNYTAIVKEQKGIGLGNIQSRVNYLNGTLHIDAREGRGTVVIIDIPYNPGYQHNGMDAGSFKQ